MSIDTPQRYEAEALGVTPVGDPSGSAYADRGPVPRSEAEVRGRWRRAGAGPASEASVRAEGPRPKGGERARLENSGEEGRYACDGVARTGGRVSPPAKSHGTDVIRSESLNVPDTASGAPISQTENSTARTYPPPKATRLLCCRVDAFVVAFRVALDAATEDELVERQAMANAMGAAELRLGAMAFEVKRSRKRDVVPFRNADLRALFDAQAPGGWNLEFVTSAAYLATHALTSAIDLVRAVAAAGGKIEAERLRRFDLAGDYVDFPLHHDDFKRIATRRARVDGFLAQTKDLDEASGELCRSNIREHRRPAIGVTGFTVAPGNPLMGRIYDKSAELDLAGREEKRTIEHARWRGAGWDGVAQVTRVEFQHRGGLLDETDLRDVNRLESRLDQMWQYDVSWLRFVDETAASRLNRAPLDVRWQAVVETRFRHEAEPIPRERNRGGAKPENVLGTARSRLAAIGRLQRIEDIATDDGELVPGSAVRERLSDEQALIVLRALLERLHSSSAEDELFALVRNESPRDALYRFIVRQNAAIARFSSIDDAREASTGGFR